MNLSKLIPRLFYLFLLYVVVVGVGSWTYLLLDISPLGYGFLLITQVVLVYLLYRSAKKRGLLGKVKPAPHVRREIDARKARLEGYKTQQLAMLAEQSELELAELQAKQENEVVDFVEILKRPGKYSAVEKYRVGFLVEGREEANEFPLWEPAEQVAATLNPQKRQVEGIIFFNENKVRISGYLKKLTETSFQYFGKANRENGGYEMTWREGVVLTMQVRADGFNEEVYILCPKPAVPAAPSGGTGYKSVNQSTAGLDVEVGQTLSVTGDLFRRVQKSPQNWPAGYYLVAEIAAVNQGAALLSKTSPT